MIGKKLTDITLAAARGLGNQMFQYAAARAFSLKIGARLRIDTRFYPLESKGSPMGFCIDEFPLQARIVRYLTGFRGPHAPWRRVTRTMLTEPPGRRYIEPN